MEKQILQFYGAAIANRFSYYVCDQGLKYVAKNNDVNALNVEN